MDMEYVTEDGQILNDPLIALACDRDGEIEIVV